jgi:hypothetical protein
VQHCDADRNPNATPTHTPTETPTGTVTNTPTNAPISTAVGPVFIAGVESGSTGRTGQANELCPDGGTSQCFPGPPCPTVTPDALCDGKVHVYDCGRDHICYTCDDFELPGTSGVTKDDGTFKFENLDPPLQRDQLIYARDRSQRSEGPLQRRAWLELSMQED